MAAQMKALAPEQLRGRAPAAEFPLVHPFTRLQAVHDEAEETSRLANLLGRTLYLGLLLPLFSLAAIALAQPTALRGGSFALLIAMGAGALIFGYAKAMNTPFERGALREFSADLDAILLYAGFAWGSGAFLILPADTSPALAVIFSACTSALVAIVLRAREPILMFAAPAGLLTALAAFLKPFALPAVSAGLAILACVFVAGSVGFSTWMKERRDGAPHLEESPL